MDTRTAALKAFLDKMPGATSDPYTPPRARDPLVLMYKLSGTMFAALADMLRQKYQGVGHRSHLDKRFWISVDLHADVPLTVVKQLAGGSYDLIRASLTRKQRAELDTP